MDGRRWESASDWDWDRDAGADWFGEPVLSSSSSMEIDDAVLVDSPVYIKGPGTLVSFTIDGKRVERLANFKWKHHLRMTECALVIDGCLQLRWTPGDGPIAEFGEDVNFTE
jgi:hypothetical protein